MYKCMQIDELKNIGCFIIWSNKYEEGFRIFISIDRMFISSLWFDEFFVSYYYVFLEEVFDYYFMVLYMFFGCKKSRRIFKFYYMWIKMRIFWRLFISNGRRLYKGFICLQW